jgi:hypothetical protein
MQQFCQRVSQGLAAATFEHKRQLVELLMDRVVVTNDTKTASVVVVRVAQAHRIWALSLRQTTTTQTKFLRKSPDERSGASGWCQSDGIAQLLEPVDIVTLDADRLEAVEVIRA